MDKAMWIILSAVVAIALAGIVLSISGEEVSDIIGDQDETVDEYGCNFEEEHFDCGDSGMSDRCAEQLCPGG